MPTAGVYADGQMAGPSAERRTRASRPAWPSAQKSHQRRATCADGHRRHIKGRRHTSELAVGVHRPSAYGLATIRRKDSVIYADGLAVGTGIFIFSNLFPLLATPAA